MASTGACRLEQRPLELISPPVSNVRITLNARMSTDPLIETRAINMRRATLLRDLGRRFGESRLAIQSTMNVNAFVSAACRHAAMPDGPIFEHLCNAAELLPSSLDSLKTESGLQFPHARVPAAVQTQLFISVVATMEGLLSEILRLVLLAFPGKIEVAPSKDMIIDAISKGDRSSNDGRGGSESSLLCSPC